MDRTSTPRPAPDATRRPAPVLRPAVPLLVAGLVLTSACGSTTQSSADPSAVRGLAAASHADEHAHPDSSAVVGPAAATSPTAPAAPAAPAVTDDPVVDLRSDLQRLLGEHALLANEVVRGVLGGQDEQVTATSASVVRNTDEIVELVDALAGPDTSGQFRTAWEGHVEVLGQYAAALQAQDDAGQQAARSAYTAAEQELAAALAAVTGGKVPQADLTAAATAHGEHLLGQADAYAAADYAAAYTLQREAFAHMVVVGDVLARGVAAAQGLPTTELDTPRRDLNSALNRLLAEHMGLMVQVLRSAQDQAPDFAAAGNALNGNTADLGAAISTLFGPEASKQFLALWAAHVEGLVQVARATDDPAAQAAGRQAQVEYAPQLARFLAGATEQRLPAIDLAAALTIHDDHLLAMADAYAEDDHSASQEQADAGYRHMVELASALAVAIGDTTAAALPQGGAATGGGGTAERDR